VSDPLKRFVLQGTGRKWKSGQVKETHEKLLLGLSLDPKCESYWIRPILQPKSLKED